MKWIKRLLLLLAALLLGITLIVAVSALLLDESDYKRLLAWGAEQFLDSELVIEGPLRLDIARDLSLTTGDILLKANDDSYRLSIGKLQTSFRLGSYLQTGTFWINHLQLSDVNVEVREHSDDDFDLKGIHIPAVVISQAQVDKLTFSYQELPPGTLHTFSLDELMIDELDEHQPLSIRASGHIEGQAFKLEGTSDSIAELVKRQQPYAIQLALSSTHIQASMQGTIVDPVNGRGLDLQIRTDIAQIRDLIEIAWDEIPVLGSLQGTLKVRGDYTAPRLEDIDLHLQRDEEVDLHVKGSVANIHNGTGLDLQLDGRSSNPEVLSWLLFKKHDRMQAFQISGKLQGDVARLSLQDLKASAKTADGLKLELGGSTVVHPTGQRLSQADADLTVQFNAPNLAAAKLAGLEDIPTLGPVSGSFRLALARDAIGLYATDIDIGRSNNHRLQLKGDVGYVRLQESPEMPELKLQTDMQTTELARLGKQLNYALPALGPARLRGSLVSRGSELVLQNASVDIGTAGISSLQGSGMFAIQLHDPSQFRVAMDVDIQTPKLEQLGKQLDYKLPPLGQARITGRLESRKSELLFRDANLLVGETAQPTIRARGSVTTQLKKGSTFDVTLDIAIAKLLTALTDKTPGDLGRLKGKALISNLDGLWGFENFNLASSGTSLYELNLSGKFDDFVNVDEAIIQSRLVIQNPGKFAQAFDLDLTGFGSYQMQGLLTVNKKSLHYQGESTLGKTRFNNNINGQLKEGKPLLSGSIRAPVLHLADFGLDTSKTAVPDKPAKDKSVSPDVFSREPLKIGFMDDVNLDLRVAIDEVKHSKIAINSVNGRLQLHDGRLRVTPLRLRFEGGNADINLDIRALNLPEYQLAITADEVTLGPLISQVQNQVPIRGHTSINLDLYTRGQSLHEMASNLSGNVKLSVENARVPSDYFVFLSVDVFGWVASRTIARQETHMNLNCLAATFTIEEGAVKNDIFIAEGPRLKLGGRIDMDLGAETLDITLIPKQKRRVFSSITPVTIDGPMRNPVITAVPVKSALKEIGTVTLLPGVFIPARIIDKLWSLQDEDDMIGQGCANFDELVEAAKREATEDKADPFW